MNWIAIGQRLPEEGVPILLYLAPNQYRKNVMYEVRMYARPDHLTPEQTDATHWALLEPPLAAQGEPYDCTRCHGSCMTPAEWPGCYTPPVRCHSEEK